MKVLHVSPGLSLCECGSDVGPGLSVYSSDVGPGL